MRFSAVQLQALLEWLDWRAARAAADNGADRGELSDKAGKPERKTTANRRPACFTWPWRARLHPSPTIPTCSRRCCWPSGPKASGCARSLRSCSGIALGAGPRAGPNSSGSSGEEAEQVEAATRAENEEKVPADRKARAARHGQPRRLAGPPAADRDRSWISTARLVPAAPVRCTDLRRY